MAMKPRTPSVNSMHDALISPDHTTVRGEDDQGGRFTNVVDLHRHMKTLRRGFNIKIVFGLLTFLVILFQVYFYSSFYEHENRLISEIQVALLGNEVSETLRVVSYLVQPFYIHLVTLHVIFTIMYGTDVILGLKLMLNNLFLFAINKLVLLAHQEPRPYWLNVDGVAETVDGYGCVTTFSNPDMSVIQLLCTAINFLLVDAQLKKLKSNLSIPLALPYASFLIGLAVYMALYLGGETFLSQFLISTVYTYLYYHILSSLNPMVSSLIRKCTFEAGANFHSNVNYFLIFLIAVVSEVLLLIGYSSKNVGPRGIFNYMECVKKFRPFLLSSNQRKFNPEEIGWHPTLHDFSYTVCIVASVLAVGFAFDSIRSIQFWHLASAAQKKHRVLVVNLWLGFCWILFTLRHEFQSTLDQIGMRGIYVNSVLMGLTYVVALGVIPVWFFGKDVKIKEDDTPSQTSPIRPSRNFDLGDIQSPKL